MAGPQYPLQVGGKSCCCEKCGWVIRINDDRTQTIAHVVGGPDWANMSEQKAKKCAAQMVAALNLVAAFGPADFLLLAVTGLVFWCLVVIFAAACVLDKLAPLVGKLFTS